MVTHSIGLFASHFSQSSLFLGKFLLVYFIIYIAVTNTMLTQKQTALRKHVVLSFCVKWGTRVVFLTDPPSPILHKNTTGTMNLKIIILCFLTTLTNAKIKESWWLNEY